MSTGLVTLISAVISPSELSDAVAPRSVYVDPTSTSFKLTSNTNVNGNNDLYVAYLFAHNDPKFGKNSNESISHCGSYVGNGQVPGPTVNIGFEPPGSNLPNWSRFSRHVDYEHYLPVVASGAIMLARSISELNDMIQFTLDNPHHKKKMQNST